MRLASKWADEPDLVEEAQEQDHMKDANVITCKKGQPLVSRWAESSGDEEDGGEEEEPVRLERRGGKKETRHKGRGDLASRLGQLAVSAGDHTGDGRGGHRDEHHGNDHGDHDHHDHHHGDQEADDRPPPTKAARDFAARLGIKLDSGPKSHTEAERKHSRDKKMRSSTERDRVKRDSAHHASPSRSVARKSHGDAPRSHKSDAKHRERRTGDNKKKQEEDKPFNQEEFNRIFAKEYQLNEDIANGKKVDWSAFDDDDF